MKTVHRHIAAAALCASVAMTSAVYADLAAFPGAQGFGANTLGARASGNTPTIVVVNSLADDPNGATAGVTTLRDAVGGSNRIIVFAVSGYINLNGSAISARSNLTILGQTAPGQGISTMGAELSFTNQNNIIMQYFRTREGSQDPNFKDSINLGNTSNVILDHMSIEFAQYDNVDDVYSASGGNGVYQNISTTFQNTIIADPVPGQQFNVHQEGSSVTYLNNIWANAHNRNPLAKGDTQFVNNTVYNYQGGYTTGNSTGNYHYDIINNYFIAGPSTTSPSNAFYQVDSHQSAYAVGNLLDSNANGTLSGSTVTPGGGTVLLSTYYSPETQFLPTLDATTSVAFNLAHAGAAYLSNGTWTHDQVDSLVDSQVASYGTQGTILNNSSSTGLSNGGFGDLGNATLVGNANYFDTVPLTWIAAHGIPATTAGLLTKNALGYYMIEQYAQEAGDQYGTMVVSAGDYNTLTYPASSPAIYTHLLVNGTGTTNGSVTISSLDTAAAAFSVGVGGNGPAGGETLNVTGGSLTVQDTIYVGYQNNAALNLSGGTVMADNIQLGNTVYPGGVATSYTGNLNLTGGTLIITNIVQGAGTPGNYTSGGAINFSGGTIEAFGNLSISAPIILSGNGTFNTLGPDNNAYAGNISSVISGTGSLIKIGAGTLTLSANNTFAGNTTITSGALLAAANGAFSNGTIFANAPAGLQLANGVTLTNPITDYAGANEFEDLPNAGSNATIAGPVNGAGSQFRVGISSANSTLTFTGATTTNDGIVLVTRGNITYAANGSFLSNNASIVIGRGGNTSTANLTVTGNALVQGNGITLGGLNGSSDSIASTANVAGNGTLSAGTAAIDLDNNDTAGTTALNLNGGTLKGGSFTLTGNNHGTTTVTFNGGTLLATAGDTATPFFPALGAGTAGAVVAKVATGGLKFNDGGFNVTIAQPLTNLSGTDGGLTKYGNGTLTLTGTNTYNGGTTLANGSLTLDFSNSTTASNILLSTSTLTLNGGTNFLINGNASTAASQTLGTLSLGTGVSNFSLTTPGAALTTTLVNITRANGSSVLLTVPANTQLNTLVGTASQPVVANSSDIGLIAGDWAAKDPTNTFIVPGGSISGFYTTNPLDGTNTAVTLTGNIDMTTPTGADLANETRIAANNYIGVLRFNTPGNFSITVKSGSYLSTQGILVTAAAGVGAFNIDAVRSSGAGDLTVWQNDTAAPLNIGVIGNNSNTSLNKNGPGTLNILNASYYTGQTYINGGTVSINTNAALGDQPTAAVVNLNGGILQANGTFPLSNGAPGTNDRPIAVGPFNGSIDVTAGNTFTVAGVISGAGSLTKINAGTLVLSGTNTLTGNVNVNGGGLYVNNGIGSGTLTLATGTTLGGTGTLAKVVLPAGLNYTLNPGTSGTGATGGTLTLPTLATNANTTLAFDLVAPNNTSPLLNVTSNLTFNGGNIVITSDAATGAASLGYYRLIDYPGALPANVASLVLPPIVGNIAYTLDTTRDPGYIDIHRGYVGDATDDGVVDLSDLNVVLNNLGVVSSSWLSGNFDGAATIDLTDLNDVLNSLGTGIAAGAGIVNTPITPTPEPASAAVLLAVLPLVVRKRRRAV
jgi:autotransporter-associated beta strand protein